MREIPPARGGVVGSGQYGYLLSPAPNAGVQALNQLLKARAKVAWAGAPFQAAGRSWPAGTRLVRGVNRAAVEQIGRTLGVEFHAVESAPAVGLSEVRAPLIGLYKTHMASMPEGWTRWLLEEYDFQYESLSDADIRHGNLSKYDIIVLPDQQGEGILNGHLAGTMPQEYAGGVGMQGALALRRFVENGGWLLAYDQAIDFAITQFALPVRNVLGGLRTEEFFIPGSLIRVRMKANDPLAYGMPEDAVAMFVRSQAMQVVPGASEGNKRVERDLAVYGNYARNDFLASGWALGGERHLAGRAAAMRVPLGRGQVVLLGFSPHFRGQPHNTYKLLFNPLFVATMKELPQVSQGAAVP
jgi:hypothetical protein